MKNGLFHLIGWGALAFVIAGCASEPTKAPAMPTHGSGANVTTANPLVSDDVAPVGGLQIDPAIARACDLPTTYFAFDSAELKSTGVDPLRALATCFTSGPLANKRLKLVGHADPRGEIHYNFSLGHRRAASVKEHLVTHGLADERIETSSVGELEATGNDEDGWARDRKVEVLLDS